MTQLNENIRVIRERAGLSQSEFAKIGGVSLTSQQHYERGSRVPDANYLARLHDAGLDVMYFFSGKTNISYLTQEESQLLTVWHAADLSRKTAAYNALVGNVPLPGVEIKKEYKFEGDFAVGENHGVINNNGK